MNQKKARQLRQYVRNILLKDSTEVILKSGAKPEHIKLRNGLVPLEQRILSPVCGRAIYRNIKRDPSFTIRD